MRKISVVCASYHLEEIEVMLSFAKQECATNNIEIADIVWVAGSYELPLAISREIQKKGIHGAVCLGVIEKGETDHGKAIGLSIFSKILDMQIEHNKPIGLGIIGPGAKPEHVAPRLEHHARNAVQALLSFF
ncbi:MAG: 6,7-dimethyl-8-ribityllumazine synthase [Candidatus Poseidoniales archaeon]|nr:6,7-dimethyl-8-ribityllumazine synthase [archaeon]MDA0843076.1 6,7-dimethyl-8-ribityllumazine synthase [archaeon]MDA1167647.1 6,7-dimethyl-8-ribityllumazine synthase [archaeon]